MDLFDQLATPSKSHKFDKIFGSRLVCDGKFKEEYPISILCELIVKKLTFSMN